MGSRRSEITSNKIRGGFAPLSEEQKYFFEMLEKKKETDLKSLMFNSSKVVKY